MKARWATARRARVSVHDCPKRPWAVTFGAAVYKDVPCRALYDRLHTTSVLVRQHTVSRVLVSGAKNEVTVMTKTLLTLGVLQTQIEEDPLGVRSFETCRRARDHFGIQSAVMISNPFHIVRCIYLAHAFGIDAVGVGARVVRRQSPRSRLKNRTREVVAIARAHVDVRRHRF